MDFDEIKEELKNINIIINDEKLRRILKTVDDEVMINALATYKLASSLDEIKNPKSYFLRLLTESFNMFRREGVTLSSPLKRDVEPYYPFTDRDGITWFDYDHCERNGKKYEITYRKDKEGYVNRIPIASTLGRV